jgi:hypothetical protein
MIPEESMPRDDDTCAFCGHTRAEHEDGMCHGKPKDEHLDAGGECPCNGFTPRDRSKEN